MKCAKVAWKSSTYDTHKKSTLPNQKFFFRVQTRRLAASFDTSTRSVAGIPTQSHVRFSVFFWKAPKAARRQSVKDKNLQFTAKVTFWTYKLIAYSGFTLLLSLLQNFVVYVPVFAEIVVVIIDTTQAPLCITLPLMAQANFFLFINIFMFKVFSPMYVDKGRLFL